MADPNFNDNEPLEGPDAHGQAAILLVEGLIHGLVARSVISVGDAVEIVEVAADVEQEIADELGDSPGTLRKSLGLLTAISTSLANDVTEHEAGRPTIVD